MSEEIITPLGTLEWIMNEHFFTALDFENLRLTVENDKKHSTRYAGQCDIPVCRVGTSDEDAKKTSMISWMVATTYVLRTMEDDKVEGKIFLCFAIHQLRLNIKIVCHAYRPEPK